MRSESCLSFIKSSDDVLQHCLLMLHGHVTVIRLITVPTCSESGNIPVTEFVYTINSRARELGNWLRCTQRERSCTCMPEWRFKDGRRVT